MTRLHTLATSAHKRLPAALRRIRLWAGPSLRQSGTLLKDAASGWQARNSRRTAAAIAFYGIFSLAPMLVIMVGVGGYWFGREAAEGLIVDQLSETLGPQLATFVQSLLAAPYVSKATAPATLAAVLVLLFGASRVLGALRTALNDVWGVQAGVRTGLKGYALTKIFDLAMVIVVGFMFLATMIANAAASVAVHRFSNLLPLPSWTLKGTGVVFSLVVVAFFISVIFHMLPNMHIPWRDVLWGAVVTSVLFTIGNYAIGIYLGRAGIGSVFGAAGSLVVLTFWMYYSAQIVLFGAEVTRAHYSQRNSPGALPTRGRPSPSP